MGQLGPLKGNGCTQGVVHVLAGTATAICMPIALDGAIVMNQVAAYLAVLLLAGPPRQIEFVEIRQRDLMGVKQLIIGKLRKEREQLLLVARGMRDIRSLGDTNGAIASQIERHPQGTGRIPQRQRGRDMNTDPRYRNA